MGDKYTNERAWSALSLGGSAIAYTPADADLPINVKAVVFDAVGSISFKNPGDTAARTGFPVAAGYPLPFVPARITAMTGATTCWLIY
ncbi:MAG: hypothetical protein P0Y64_16790 [Candidatus Sphingomonas colombiensis]|nr:hypothetical protein [Sphingomonas sp.]WEK42977.1 MAG: hypothetical protein P0Y64_16790 [Sphingomonas sp.]